MILPTARPNDISWYRCTALEAQSPPHFNTRGIAHNCHTTATTIYRLSGSQPALLRPGAVPVFCQSVRAAVQRPGWELLDQSPWQLSHWSHLTVDIYLLFFFFLQLWINISLQILQKWLSRGYDVPEFSPLWLLEILSQRHVIEKHCPEAPALYFCFTQDSSSSFICIFFFSAAFLWIIRVALRLPLFSISSSTSQ